MRAMSISEWNWPTIAGVLTATTVACSAAFLVLRTHLASVFVRRQELSEVVARLAGVEKALSNAAGHADIQALERRLGGLAQSVAAITASVDGIQRAVGTVSHQLNMLFEAQMKKEQG